MLEIRNLKKYYASYLALDIPYLDMKDGIYWINGKNGSGKSTFLKCLAGLLPYRGGISMQGHSLSRHPERYLQYVNYSATEPVYPDFLTGQDLIHFFLSAKHGNSVDVNPLVNGFQMQYVIRDRPISQYSSGMLKKLSLILAFIGQSRLILLDEPFITLDLDASAFLADQIYTRSKQGATILVSAHTEHFPLEATRVNLELGKLLS
ncbi:ABC transporter ATP-binding protein [Sphingobacterium sp. LRF_L2]|uniref:ABC transporter ATP-binding protein n=1 Tax=Sphingobacterium sp. LRF_L2 TaxID=3369421 RepID=UPI003F623803